MPTALPLTDKTDRKMKKAILLIVAYLLVQLLCGVLIGAGVNLYAKLFAPTGAAPLGMASVPIMLCSLAAMLLVLWKLGYLKNDGRAYDTGSPGQLAWGIMGGMGAIVVSTYIVELLPPLPDLMESSFDELQGSWVGIGCICLLGPFLEEVLFRRAVTGELLRHYRPWVAIGLSGVLFGLFHINPAQITGAVLMGVFLAWLYYRTDSLVACTATHIVNNSLSVWLSTAHPEVETMRDLIGNPALYWALPVAGLAVMGGAVWQLGRKGAAPLEVKTNN